MTYGVTPTGFVIKPLDVIKGGFEDKERLGISQSVNVSARSILGQINGILADRHRELWELAQAVYNSTNPDQNEDFSQDSTAAITGSKRLAATYSIVDCNMSLNGTTTVPAGSVATVLGNPTARFQLIGVVAAGIFTAGDVVSVGAGTYIGRFQALVKGPVAASAGTLTVITTPITGWNSITNAGDAIQGRNVETNSALRIRRETNLAAAGSSTLDAVIADVSNVDTTNIKQVLAFENSSDNIDANGLPPRSFEVLVNDGAIVSNDVIAQAIWQTKPAGMRPVGQIAGNAVDSTGVVHVMYFSRPTTRNVYLSIDITINSLAFPVGGDALVKAAVAATKYGMGAGVVLSALYGAVFTTAGVVKIVTFRAGFAPAPAGTVDLVLAARELAVLDTSRITINHV